MLGLGLGLGLGRSSGGTAFDPATLFTGQSGGWYDPSDLGTVWQDVGRTVPGAVDAVVGSLDDKSGNGRHLLRQNSDPRRPILRQSGALYYLEFDGVDDCLLATFGMTYPFDRVSAFDQITYTNGRYILDGGEANQSILQNRGGSPNIAQWTGGLGTEPTPQAGPLGTPKVVTERWNGASSSLQVNSSAAATGTLPSVALTGISVGDAAGAGAPANIKFYGVLCRSGTLTASEIASYKAYLATKSGVSL